METVLSFHLEDCSDVRNEYFAMCFELFSSLFKAPQWGAADAEIKVPSGENTELKRSPFQAWSRSV